LTNCRSDGGSHAGNALAFQEFMVKATTLIYDYLTFSVFSLAYASWSYIIYRSNEDGHRNLSPSQKHHKKQIWTRYSSFSIVGNDNVK
jgi:hypothetical protein